MATVVLESGVNQVITIASATRMKEGEGGEIPTRTVAMEPGERSRYRLPATKSDDGYVAVAFQTDRTPIYLHVIDPGGDALDALKNVGPVQAWFGGASIGLSWVVLAGLWKLRKEGDEPEVAR